MLKPYWSAPEKTWMSFGSSVAMNSWLKTVRQQLLEEVHRVDGLQVDLDLAAAR